MSAYLPPPEDEPFLRAILADLRNDAPRLVYADHLLERGDPRGELIVVQCLRERLEREGKTGKPEHGAALARELELLQAHTPGWVDPFGLRRWWGEFTRGFIGRLTISFHGLQLKWKLFAQLPLEKLSIKAQRDHINGATIGELAWLAREPSARRLETIVIETASGQATFDAPTLLADFERCEPEEDRPIWRIGAGLPDPRADRALRGIEWRWPEPMMAHDVVRHLEPLPLEQLRVNLSERLLPIDLRTLVSAPALRSLQTLSLGWLSGDDAAIGVVAAPALPGLTSLALTAQHYASFGPRVSAALAESSLLPSLVSLRADVLLDDVLVRALEERAPALDELDTARELPDLDRFLASAPTLIRRLRRVSVCDTGSIAKLAVAPLDRLELLSLRLMEISEDDATKLVRSLPDASSLELARCRTSPQALAILRTRWPSVAG